MKLPRLSNLEMRIMEVLWKRGPSSVRDILSDFSATKPPAYTTVQTMMVRLETKKAVRRAPQLTAAHIFEAAIPRDVARRRLIDEFLSVFGGESRPIMMHLVEAGKLKLEDVQEAEKYIRAIKEDRQKAMTGLILDHLWQSTLFAGGAGLLVLMLASNSAATRFWLWFAASVKFLVPFAVLAALWAALLPPSLPVFVSPSLLVAQPFTALAAQPFTASKVSALIAPAAAAFDFVPLLLAVWALGFAVVSGRRIIRLRRVGQLRAAATDITIDMPAPMPIEIKSVAASLEPGLAGIFHPVILLPDGIQTRLSPSELSAILAHELCHWARRDNLLAAIYMTVEALFWFHPLVWWLGARLGDERERACDETVLAGGAKPLVYAESILKICKLYIHSPLTCMPGASGANLKSRMERIVENRPAAPLNPVKRMALGLAAIAALAAPLALPLLAAPVPPAQATIIASDAPEKIAERRAEQALPRRPVPFDPAAFDEYVGYYELSPTLIFTIHRDGGHFLTRLTGQPDVEIFAESQNKFFATEVPAQISFDRDASGQVTDLILHQNGQQQRAPEFDQAAARKFEAGLVARIRAHTPSPGTESALRAYLAGLQSGKPDLGAMTPALAAAAGPQMPVILATAQALGPLQSLSFKTVGPGGADIYDVKYARGVMEYRVAPLTADGKLQGLASQRLP